LGYGIVAYVNILYAMVWAFLFFSLLMIPTIRGFKAGTQYETALNPKFVKTMISNIGYSNMECRNIPVSLGNIAITCPFGKVGKIFEYGINNDESGSPVDACANNDQNSACKPNSDRIRDILNEAIGSERYTAKFSASGSDFWRENSPSKACSDPTNLFFV